MFSMVFDFQGTLELLFCTRKSRKTEKNHPNAANSPAVSLAWRCASILARMFRSFSTLAVGRQRSRVADPTELINVAFVKRNEDLVALQKRVCFIGIYIYNNRESWRYLQVLLDLLNNFSFIYSAYSVSHIFPVCKYTP